MRRALILTGAGVVLLGVLALMKVLELRFNWPDSPRRNFSAGAIAGAGFLKLADWLVARRRGQKVEPHCT